MSDVYPAPIIKLRQAENTKTPIETLIELSKNKHWHIRSVVAQNPNTPAETINELAEDKDWEVRASAVRNPKISINALLKFSKQEDEGLHYYIAANPSTTAEVLINLAQHKNSDTLYWIARNPNCPEAMRLWIDNGGFAGLSLTEFLEKVGKDINILFDSEMHQGTMTTLIELCSSLLMATSNAS